MIRFVRLGDFCEQDRNTVRPGDASELRYIGLETIESGTGQFQSGELSKTPEIPQANSFRFGPEHVLYGKLRPYLNKVSLPDFNGKCSTEIIPLKPKPGLDRRYLSYFLRSASVVDRISRKTAGARMPRADMDFVLGLQIPLPPLDEQNRVVDLLSRAEGIVRLRRGAQNLAAEIIPALFLDMFGDPATNPKGWRIVNLRDAAFFQEGPGIMAKDFRSSGVPLVRLAGLKSDKVTLAGCNYLDPDLVERKWRQFKLVEGDILVLTSATFGSPSIVGSEAAGAIFYTGIIRFRSTLPDLQPNFLRMFLGSPWFLKQAEALASGAVIRHFGPTHLKQMKLVLPPLDLQVRFGKLAEIATSILAQQSRAYTYAMAAFEAGLSRAFAVGGLLQFHVI